jgi:hypothetical protein
MIGLGMLRWGGGVLFSEGGLLFLFFFTYLLTINYVYRWFFLFLFSRRMSRWWGFGVGIWGGD